MPGNPLKQERSHERKIDSFFLPEYMEEEKKEAYMAHFAGRIKGSVNRTPVIAARRIQAPTTAEKILKEATAHLIGLARVLLADPLWPKKAEGIVKDPMIPCEPTCSLCLKRATRGRPVFCSQWPRARREAFLMRVGEPRDEKEDAMA
jgi:2,4-dienoyl-CoA reductase-like NADH-dependent reductase (Old Yellow Enzyme family)